MSRAKGFADWNPRPETLLVVEHAREVLQQYSSYGAMTCRQIFYRLVGQYDYDKTERAYARLCEYLVRARRARLIPFDSIRDDGTVTHFAGGVDTPQQWWQSLEDEWRSFGRDRNTGQETIVELWCEAAGMAPMLAGIARPYGVPVYSTGGFSSVTVTYEIARRCSRRDRSTTLLHVGDFDPSGESIFESIAQDAMTFFYQSKHWDGASEDLELDCRRVALTQSQVDEFDLPTAPPKATDSRSARWDGETCQLEAMAPDDLERLVIRTIEGLYDMSVYDVVIDEERHQRDAIRAEWTDLIEARS